MVVLHGGPEKGFTATAPFSPPYVRMIPFARRIRTLSRDRIGVVRVRHTQTGWNGAERTTLGQVRWTLGDITARVPHLPIGLLGHSLGGRTALAAAGHTDVRSVVALAPWVTEHDGVDHLLDRDVLVLQGARDRECPPEEARAFVERLRAAGGRVRYEELPGGHGMLREAGRWHELAARHLVNTLLPPA